MRLVLGLFLASAMLAQTPVPSPFAAGGAGGGGSGTVTSVGLAGTANQITVTGTSPITSSGSWTLSFPTNMTLPGTTTGTFSGNVTGNLTGTASTATNALSLGGNLANTYAPLASPTFTGTVTIGDTLLSASGAAFIGNYPAGRDNYDTNFIGISNLFNNASIASYVDNLTINRYDSTNADALDDAFNLEMTYSVNGTGDVGQRRGLQSVVELINPGAVSYAAATVGTVQNRGSTVAEAYGLLGSFFSFSGHAVKAAGNLGFCASVGGTIDECSAYYAYAPLIFGGTFTTAHLYYGQDLGSSTATNSYYEWQDSRGVRRVKEDNTFDSVGQAIEALYNPRFTKYTPGLANFERIVTQWETDVAVITTEKGGTGTLRNMQLGDAGVHVLVSDLKTTGAATGKKIVCVDTSTGQLYASSSGVACAN